jgi:hypothetical protein
LRVADDSLSKYRAKRSPDTTPEPMGAVSTVPGRLFVVHKHAARNLHFDLRLEVGVVLDILLAREQLQWLIQVAEG